MHAARQWRQDRKWRRSGGIHRVPSWNDDQSPSIWRKTMEYSLSGIYEAMPLCKETGEGQRSNQPILPNHATVSASDSVTGRGRSSSSARLRDGSKCIQRRGSATPVTVAAGARWVKTSAMNSLTYAVAKATG